MTETIKEIYNDHKTYRRQIIKLTKSDLIKTYRGAALGWAWALIKPLVTLFVFWFGFTIGLRHGKPINGYPYLLWLVAGFLPWFFMRDMLSGGAECIRKYKHLVTKIKFPISIIPTYTNLSHLVVHIVLCVIAIAAFAVAGFYPDIYYLQIPIYMLMMFAYFEVWALFAGILSGMSKDFLNLVKSFTQPLFWLSGVIYDVNKIKHVWVRTILKFNPVTVISSGYRKAFVYKEWFWEDKIELLGITTIFLITFFLAIWSYRKLRKDLPDVL